MPRGSLTERHIKCRENWMEVIQFKQKFPKSQTMAYKISIFIALLGIYSGLFADAKDKCETELDKEYLKDCENSGDHPPKECKRSGKDDLDGTGSDTKCLEKLCAKECQDAGGDEILTYPKTVSFLFGIGWVRYYNLICCKSKTEGQARKAITDADTTSNLVKDLLSAPAA